MTTHKPHIEPEHISNGSADTAVEWMEYLGDTFGVGGALYALQYYGRLGWISEAARRTLTSYLRGMSTVELHNKKYDEPGTLDGPLGMFSGTAFGVHAKSLAYVAHIANDDLEEQVLLSRLAENKADHEPPAIE